jgi:hypothetical protein
VKKTAKPAPAPVKLVKPPKPAGPGADAIAIKQGLVAVADAIDRVTAFAKRNGDEMQAITKRNGECLGNVGRAIVDLSNHVEDLGKSKMGVAMSDMGAIEYLAVCVIKAGEDVARGLRDVARRDDA